MKQKSKFKGRDMMTMSWDASENGKPITIHCFVVPIGRADSFIAIVWGTSEAQKRYGKPIRKLLNSLATIATEPPE